MFSYNCVGKVAHGWVWSWHENWFCNILATLHVIKHLGGGGLAHSVCEDNLHYWKMRIMDYLKRTKTWCISNTVAWPAGDVQMAKMLMETTYPPAAASGAPLHEWALYPPCCLSLCVARPWSLTAFTCPFSLFLSLLLLISHSKLHSKASPPRLFLVTRPQCLFIRDFFFLYEDGHTKYTLLLCRWQSWNVLYLLVTNSAFKPTLPDSTALCCLHKGTVSVLTFLTYFTVV